MPANSALQSNSADDLDMKSSTNRNAMDEGEVNKSFPVDIPNNPCNPNHHKSSSSSPPLTSGLSIPYLHNHSSDDSSSLLPDGDEACESHQSVPLTSTDSDTPASNESVNNESSTHLHHNITNTDQSSSSQTNINLLNNGGDNHIPSYHASLSDENDENQISGFIRKTFNMMSDNSTSDIVSWDEKGESFIVKKEIEFSDSVLPKYFRHKNFSSFVRQLNFYGFHKRSHQNQHTKFQHPYFKRGQPQNLRLIKRKITEQSTNFKDNMQTITATVTDLKRQYDDLFNVQQQLLYLFSRYLRAYPLPPSDLTANTIATNNLFDSQHNKKQKLLYENNNLSPGKSSYIANNYSANECGELSALQEVLNSTPQGQALLAQTGLAGLSSLPSATLAQLHQQAQAVALHKVQNAANYSSIKPLNSSDRPNIIHNNASFSIDGAPPLNAQQLASLLLRGRPSNRNQREKEIRNEQRMDEDSDPEDDDSYGNSHARNNRGNAAISASNITGKRLASSNIAIPAVSLAYTSNNNVALPLLASSSTSNMASTASNPLLGPLFDAFQAQANAKQPPPTSLPVLSNLNPPNSNMSNSGHTFINSLLGLSRGNANSTLAQNASKLTSQLTNNGTNAAISNVLTTVLPPNILNSLFPAQNPPQQAMTSPPDLLQQPHIQSMIAAAAKQLLINSTMNNPLPNPVPVTDLFPTNASPDPNISLFTPQSVNPPMNSLVNPLLNLDLGALCRSFSNPMNAANARLS
jgi:hypothetical protein